MTPSPFIAPARAQTMLRDFEAHRKAVLSGDVANIDATWDRCERWVDQLRPDFTEQAEATQQRIKTLEEALHNVREEICIGPVDDVLWHQKIPAETTVDFICNTLNDGWDYDKWLADREALRGKGG